MDTIKRIETIDLLKGFWEYLEKIKYPQTKNLFDADMEEIISNFIQHKYGTIDFKSDIWTLLRTKE